MDKSPISFDPINNISPNIVIANMNDDTKRVYKFMRDKTNIKRVRDNIALLTKCPNIVSVHCIIDDMKHENLNGSCIVMEHCDKGDLFDLATYIFDAKKTELYTEKFVKTILKEILKGLSFIHSLGIAHCDIKPENIALTKECKVKIIDIDDMIYSDDVKRPQRGTLGFMAPEIKFGSKNLISKNDYRKSDVYSLGITLFVLLTGFPPYEEIINDENMIVKSRHYKELRLNPNNFWKNVQKNSIIKLSEEVINIITAMIQYDQHKRPSVNELLANKWFHENIYTQDELYETLSQMLS